MATLYVTEQGVQVHKRGERLLVQRAGEVLQDIPHAASFRFLLL